jgi:hypothetical protein
MGAGWGRVQWQLAPAAGDSAVRVALRSINALLCVVMRL